MEKRYLFHLRVSDYYMGEALEAIREQDNNTIVIVMGDHPAKGLFSTNFAYMDKSIQYDLTCNENTTINDNLFLTTGFIMYMGDNPKYKEMFDRFKGKIVKTPVDQQDVIYTVQ